MSWDNLTALAIFAGALVCTPGPANMVLMAAGARAGFRACLSLIAGVTFGKLFVHLSLALGLWHVIESFPQVLFALKIIGALYVLWLGWKILHITIQKSGVWKAGFVAGLAVHPTNPKAWAMVVSAYGQFIEADKNWWQQTLIIALVFLLWQCFAHTLWCYIGARAVKITANERQQKRLMLVLAVMMVSAVLWSLFN